MQLLNEGRWRDDAGVVHNVYVFPVEKVYFRPLCKQLFLDGLPDNCKMGEPVTCFRCLVAQCW